MFSDSFFFLYLYGGMEKEVESLTYTCSFRSFVCVYWYGKCALIATIFPEHWTRNSSQTGQEGHSSFGKGTERKRQWWSLTEEDGGRKTLHFSSGVQFLLTIIFLLTYIYVQRKNRIFSFALSISWPTCNLHYSYSHLLRNLLFWKTLLLFLCVSLIILHPPKKYPKIISHVTFKGSIAIKTNYGN